MIKKIDINKYRHNPKKPGVLLGDIVGDNTLKINEIIDYLNRLDNIIYEHFGVNV